MPSPQNKTKAKPDALIKKSDFENKQYVVVMRNITTSTDLPKGQYPELAEVGKEELSLLLPATACSEGHLLLLRFFEEPAWQRVRNSPRSVQDKSQRLALTAKVARIEAAPGGKCLATLDLQQYVDKEWQTLLRALSAMQKSVNGLVKRIKD
jgi:hypothetical protein